MHEGGFTLERGADDTIEFFDQYRRKLETAPPPHIDVADPLAPATRRLAAQGITITPRTLPAWDGGPLNLGYAIDVVYVLPGGLARSRASRS